MNHLEFTELINDQKVTISKSFLSFLFKFRDVHEIHSVKHISKNKLELIAEYTKISVITMPESAFLLFLRHVLKHFSSELIENIETTGHNIKINNRVISVILRQVQSKAGRPRKLTKEDRDLLEELKENSTQEKIASLLKISQSAVNKYLNGKQWVDLTPAEKNKILSQRTI